MLMRAGVRCKRSEQEGLEDNFAIIGKFRYYHYFEVLKSLFSVPFLYRFTLIESVNSKYEQHLAATWDLYNSVRTSL